MPKTRKSNRPAKKRWPDKHYRPPSLPIKCSRHQPLTTASLHKFSAGHKESPGYHTQAKSGMICSILWHRPRRKAKPQGSLEEQVPKPGAQEINAQHSSPSSGEQLTALPGSSALPTPQENKAKRQQQRQHGNIQENINSKHLQRE